MALLLLSNQYKKDVFCNFVYGFEPFKNCIQDIIKQRKMNFSVKKFDKLRKGRIPTSCLIPKGLDCYVYSNRR